ncbi:hypothetical protein [Marinivivus vitaminiproducens]|uniref:hypothetical protein n=1 Tax=Marinivivus vitaminiproducens TaxID=3035935 RepID=UPI00279E5D0C|nr:hypothetical protein P4R82_04015 [Geminicoccaceae bacterium SCSIO 64248]
MTDIQLEPWSRPRASRRMIPARRCARRTAQALAAGRRIEEVAALQRVPVRAVLDLLDADGFQALLAHYRAVAALDAEARLERLTQVALELLELGLETGDLQAAMFVVAERRAGRHPGRTLAAHAIARIEAEAARTRPVPAPRRPTAPRARPPLPAGPWNHLAAAFGAAEVERCALDRLAALPALRRRTLDRLADRLLGEAERLGAASCPGLPPSGLLEAGSQGGLPPSALLEADLSPGLPRSALLEAGSQGGLPPFGLLEAGDGPQATELLARLVARVLNARYTQGDAATLRLEARRKAGDFGRIASPEPPPDALFAGAGPETDAPDTPMTDRGRTALSEPGAAEPAAPPAEPPQAARSAVGGGGNPPQAAQGAVGEGGNPPQAAQSAVGEGSNPHPGAAGASHGPLAASDGAPPDRAGLGPLLAGLLGHASWDDAPDPLAAYDRYLDPPARGRRRVPRRPSG